MPAIEMPRVLSLDITPRGIAYACLEGPQRLVNSGTVQVKGLSKHEYVRRTESLFWRFMPDLLVLEKAPGEGSRRGKRAEALIHRIELLALGKSLPVRKVSRGDVRSVFKGTAETKEEIAQAIAAAFPEQLAERLPKPRRAWDSEAERMNIFDAVSFALAAYYNPEPLEEIPA